MTEREALNLLILRSTDLLNRLDFDLHGINGQGGGGGLVIATTIKSMDQLRMALNNISEATHEPE